jgi:hypothetical protein
LNTSPYRHAIDEDEADRRDDPNRRTDPRKEVDSPDVLCAPPTDYDTQDDNDPNLHGDDEDSDVSGEGGSHQSGLFYSDADDDSLIGSSFRRANPVVIADSLAADAVQEATAGMYAFDPLFAVEPPSNSILNADYDDPSPDFVQFDLDYLQNRVPKRRSKSLPFDRNHAKPKLAWERLPIYSVDEATAPRRNFLFVCERPDMNRYSPSLVPNEPLETPFTSVVDIWRRGDRGMMLRNKLDVCHHYEIPGGELDNFVRDAQARGIKTNYYPADGSIKTISKDGHYLFLCNGGDFQGILSELDLRTIAEDLFKEKDDPKLVPKLNKRGNRGPSLIFTGSQGLNRGARSQFATPCITAGSKRYWPAYVTMSKAMRSMAAYQASPDDEPLPDPFPVLGSCRHAQEARELGSKDAP